MTSDVVLQVMGFVVAQSPKGLVVLATWYLSNPEQERLAFLA